MSTRTKARHRDVANAIDTARKKVRISLKKKLFVQAILETIRQQELTPGAPPLRSFEDIKTVWQAAHKHQRMYNLITLGGEPVLIDHVVNDWEKAEGEEALGRLQRQNKVIEKIGGWHTILWLREQYAIAEQSGDAIRMEEFRQLVEERKKELNSLVAGIARHSSMLSLPGAGTATLFLEAEVETAPGSGEYEPADVVWEEEDDDDE